MNGDSLIFQVVVIAVLALVFGVVVAGAVRFVAAASHWMHHRRAPRG